MNDPAHFIGIILGGAIAVGFFIWWGSRKKS